MSGPRLTADGPLLFARYAYPPNELGYCGGDDHRALLEQTSAGVVDGGLRQSLREFEGAWPYLELIAAANHLDDPLDAKVVEAYWLGSALLERVGPALLELRARARALPADGVGNAQDPGAWAQDDPDSVGALPRLDDR